MKKMMKMLLEMDQVEKTALQKRKMKEKLIVGETTLDAVSENDDDGIGGRAFGEHTSNPVNDPDTEEEDNETPREGVGNQVEGHPSDYADSVGGAFSDEDCIDRD